MKSNNKTLTTRPFFNRGNVFNFPSFIVFSFLSFDLRSGLLQATPSPMLVRHVWAVFNLTPSVRRATEAILSIVYRPKVRVISVFLGPLQYHVLQIAFFLLRIHRDKARIAFGKESVFPFVFPCFVPLISRRGGNSKTFCHAILAHSFGE